MFKEILKRIVNETGNAIGAVLMGFDGIAIDQYLHREEGLDLQVMAIEYSTVLKEICHAAEILNIGTMEEVSIRTQDFTTIIRVIAEGYFVALTLQQDGNFGKGRYLLMREQNALVEGLA
ncbi:MAG: roadblock/LC7 domain-containing protein [Deltaproteobacteria bacterium]|jgi:predicted regulator of Ras-like GTPase activity (Roadblock/LC7/MglB family)|nr:roadblock/LC7 domain-containing protein [Deltaproteobacteria bacterium]MBW2518764.1 roadblock/LC7 domain-containing protein [Deltaproteobacteria bacterium]